MGLELGIQSAYDREYNPDRLFALPRAEKRREIGIDPKKIPFVGFDTWNHYEVSWLNAKGKPIAAIARVQYDCASENIIESKALKLYFNSFNHTRYRSAEALAGVVRQDLEARILAPVIVEIVPISEWQDNSFAGQLVGECIDDLEIECSVYTVAPHFLTTHSEVVTESLHSHLLKSNCLITNQPDWGSVEITYTGKQIDKAGLLRYIVSFRNHNEFHEQCIERIYADLCKHCQPTDLLVNGRYTRRGGLDINPVRASSLEMLAGASLGRLVRQ